MGNDRLPALFISHGAPTLILEDIPARTFLKDLGRQYRNVRAVLCIPAHWNLPELRVNSVEVPETIHDFYGFPRELYDIRYPVHGNPALAARITRLLNDKGIACRTDPTRGLDHGAWVPLMLMFPAADIPIVQLSIQRNLDPAFHFALGVALAGLRNEGVLIAGSGGTVHPLGDPAASLGAGAPTEPWAMEFSEWLTDAVTRGDREQLIGYRARAPHAQRAHPYPDHYMPLLTAMGAAEPGARGTSLHHSWDLGDLGMDAFVFG